MSSPDRQNPRSPEHAEQQRQRILDAAEAAFIEYGFHAASMARIAEKAEISQGLTYRYFANKNAVILAIIARQIEVRRAGIRALQSQSQFVERVIELFQSWVRRDDRAMNPVLFLEMSAEASRDPEIARALAEADQTSRGEFKKWLRRMAEETGREASEDDLEKRALALGAFIEGLALRAVREPGINHATLAESARLFLPRLLAFDDGRRCD
ncbi:MAG: TetR/AcrR family transcriptional regulator [Opitutales bacterium]